MKRKVVLWSVAATLIVGGCLLVCWLWQLELTAKSELNARDLSLALMLWSVDHVPESPQVVAYNTFPVDITQIAPVSFRAGWLKNPHTGRAIREIGPVAPSRLGDFRYIPESETFEMTDGTTQTAITGFLLVVYTPLMTSDRFADKTALKRLGPQAGVVLQNGILDWKGDDWEQHMGFLKSHVLTSHLETPTEALTRLGYK